MLKLVVPQAAGGFFANAGQAIVERSLVRALPETGHVQLRILALGTEDDHGRLAEYCGPLVRDSLVSVHRFHPATVDAVLADADGVILHGLPPARGFRRWLRKAKITRRLPVVQHIHSLFLAEFETKLYAELWETWHGWPPAAWVAPSECTARRARAVPSPGKRRPWPYPAVTVVPHGVVREQVGAGNRAHGRRTVGAHGEDVVILSLARLSPEKCDYRQLVRAVHELRQAAPNGDRILLVLAGGLAPDDVAYLRQLRGLLETLGMERQTRIIENLEDTQKPDVLAAADLFVSLACNPQESFGIALLEAQAAGLPIVASEWNGYPEVLPPFYRGKMVPTVASHACARELDWRHLSEAGTADYAALVGLLRGFLEHPDLRAEAAQAGRENVGRFTWGATAQQLVDVWNDLAAAHRAGRRSPVRSPRDHVRRRSTSPVEGLATMYAEPALRFHVRGAVACADLPPQVQDLLATTSGQDVSLAEWRRVSGLTVPDSDRLFLRLVRDGALRIGVSDPAAPPPSGPILWGAPEILTRTD